MDGIIQTLSKRQATWSSDALDQAYATKTWDDLVRELYTYVLTESKGLKYSNVTELNEVEIANVIQRKFEEMNQSKDPRLLKFIANLKFFIDDNLTKYIETATLHSITHRSNVQHLQKTVSKEIIHLLDKSPPEYMANARMFLNQEVPSNLRVAIWVKGLGITKGKLDTLLFHRLAPSLDVSISRKCYSILESFFPDYSNQSNANVLKTVTVNFFRKRDVTISNTPECMDFIGRFIIMFVPLLIAFDFHDLKLIFDVDVPTKSGGNDEGRDRDKDKQKGNENNNASDDVVRGGGHVSSNNNNNNNNNNNSSSSSSKGCEAKAVGGDGASPPSPPESQVPIISQLARGFAWSTNDVVIKVIDKALEILLGNKFFAGMQEIKRFASKASVEAKRVSETVLPVVTKTLSLLELKRPLLFDILKDATLHAHASTGQNFSHAFRKESFEEFLQYNMATGLALLVPLDTLTFVWDNCIIAGTFEILPLIMVSIILGNADDMINMKTTANAIQSLRNFCSKLPVSNLKRLVADNCFQEIKDLFAAVPISNSYDMCLEENGDIIIQTIYQQLFSE